jgi:hypothetical protein
MNVYSRLLLLAAVMVAASISSSPACAQDLATLSGRVTDPKGLPVPSVSVQAINVNTNVAYPAQTNDVGLYNISALPPGTYRVIVQKDGFVQIVKPGVELHVSDIIAVNFALEIGSVTQSVTVESGAPMVNTESGSVSTVIDRQFVNNLPMNGRSFNTLLQLTPGVVIAPSSYNAPGQFSIAGQRASANSFTVDGVSANFGVQAGIGVGGESGLGQSQAFSALGGTSSLASVDDLQEFRIETSSFSPEFGRQPGGQVLLTTRSGTNDWHGGTFDYFRNTVMDANDWFAKQAGLGRAAERHNDFGGYLGGPIRKGRTFFFFSYEGARLRLPTTIITPVPSLSSRQSAPSTLAPFLDAYPLPNGPISPGGYTAQYAGNYSNSGTLNATSLRIDHVFNPHFSIFGRYNYAPSQTVSLSSPSELDTTLVNTQTFTVGLNSDLGNAISNSLRGNYSMQNSNFQSALHAMGGATLPAPSLYLGNLSFPSNELNFQTYDTYYFAAGTIGHNQSKQVNIVDDLSWLLGVHKLKFGVDGRIVFLNIHPAVGSLGYSADSVQDFLATGQMNMYSTTTSPAQVKAPALSLYAQDTWSVTQRLTLSYGLRWELSPAPSARGNTLLASWENVNDPPAIALAPFGTPLWKTQYANFAPRFGLAYRLNSKGDFVLRAGTGVFYDLGLGNASAVPSYWPNSAFNYYPVVSVPLTDASSYLPALSLEPPYSDQVFGFSPNLKLPRSYQWNVAVEKSFAGQQAVSVTYVGQAGRDQLRNSAIEQPNSNFSGIFYLTQNDARSNYNALQVQYRRPLSGRVQALLNYTYSHSLDNVSDDAVAGPSDTVISSKGDYASSDFDVRQSFSGAVTWQLPSTERTAVLSAVTKGWSLDTIVVARSGFWFNAKIVLGASEVAGQATRPDLVAGQPFWVANTQAPGGQTLNPNAFVIPSTVRQGTEGRNDIPGFGFTQADVSLVRDFSLGERVKLQFRTDAFNILNHPNFANPLGYIQFGPLYFQSTQMLNQALGGLNPLFQEGGPRSLQLSLKLTF